MTIPPFPRPFSRRSLLKSVANGFGHLALLGLLQDKGLGASLIGRASLVPRAKRVIFLFMHGGPSHLDTFDYKPLLLRDDDKPLPYDKPRVQFAQTGKLGKPRWDFAQHGQSGAWVSSLFPHVAKQADDICFLKAVHGTNAAHGGALLKLHTGADNFARPSMGSWISYGLGTENANLPSFITINPTQGHGGSANWSSSFLPAHHQGVWLGGGRKDSAEKKEVRLPFVGSGDAAQRRKLDFIQAMNRDHAAPRNDDVLEARIRSFETAFAMQSEAPAILDCEGESDATKALYGIGEKTTDEFGRRCLLARRLSESGVRFVQVTHGYWDQHSDLVKEHTRLAAECDQPIAGLLADLKLRGLLDETLVLWGGEFGRTPTMQGKDGRDHNPHAFTMWMAGGGVKGGMSYGVTDDYGFYAADEKMHVNDLHATLLHLLGLDHEKLTYAFGGRSFRLTDVAGEVVTKIMA